MHDLYRWASSQPRPPKFFAAWSWLTDHDTIVDVIDPGEPEEWVDERLIDDYVADVEATLFGDETLPLLTVRGHQLRGLWTEVTPIEPDGRRQWLYVGVLDAAFEEVVESQLLDELALGQVPEDARVLAAEATGRMISVWMWADLEPKPGSLPQAVLSRLE